MHDDMTPIRLPTATLIQSSPLAFLPGQIAAGLLAGGRFGGESDGPYLANRTVAICEALVERMKKSPLWAPPTVTFSDVTKEL